MHTRRLSLIRLLTTALNSTLPNSLANSLANSRQANRLANSLAKTRAIALAIIVAMVTLSACASVVTKPAKPKIELVSIKPLNINAAEQKLRFQLRVINPNSFDIPVEAINFIARFNNTNIANGKSFQSVVIPANSEALLSLDVTAGLSRLASTLGTLLQGKSLNLDYELSGTVQVETWPTPIPFDVVGVMDLSDI